MGFELNDFQLTILKDRYSLPNEKSWEDVSKRVANHLAKAEHNGDITLWEKRFNWVMSNGYYFPGGRVLYGSGRRIGGLLNCFCKGVEDDRHSIAKLMHDMYLISTFGGGVGTNYSAIRPKGDPVQGVQGVAPGVVSEMKKIDSIGAEVKSGGGRRVALIGTLDISHPDLLEFLDIKLDLHQLNNHNISINYTSDFFEAVKKDEEWTFKFRGQVYNRYKILGKDNRELFVVATNEDNVIKTAENHYKIDWLETFTVVGVENIKAKDLWSRICENAVESGEPGFLFIDNIKKNFATRYFEEYSNCNPCTEAILPDDGNCNLGSLNLSLMYDEENNDVDWSLLAKVIGISVRMLDNVLTMNVYPTPETKVVAEKSRRIGLGVMGLHHLLIKMGLRYGSEESLEFVERLFATIRNEAFKASIEIAKDKGSFPEFNYERYLENEYVRRLPTRILKSIEKHGLRNAVILSIAPTGTISMVAGTSSGIEPIFAPMYKRKYRKDNVLAEEIVVDSMFSNAVENRVWDHIVGAYDVTPEEHIALQAAVQDYVDQAISKCVVEGTLINTNFGTIKIEDIAKKKDVPEGKFTAPYDGVMVVDENGDMKKVIEVYNGGKKKCYAIKFSNGKTIECSLNHKFKTSDGWVKVTDLDIGDRVFYRTTKTESSPLTFENNMFGYEGLIRIQKPKFDTTLTSTISREYPEFMDEDFALFLGMWLADGFVNKNSIGIVEKNEVVGELIDDLFIKNFGVQPKISIDKRTGVKTHLINSRVFVKHFKDKFGYDCVSKRVPEEILRSNNNVKKSFLRGLTLDGYKIDDVGKLVIYEGYSKDIAEKCISICAGLGYQYYYGEKKVKNGLKSKKAYSISIYYNDGCDLIPIETHKIPSGGRKWIQRFVENKDRGKIVESIGVGSIESYKRRNFKRSMDLCCGFMVEESLTDLGYVDYDKDLTCVKITSIEYIGIKQVWDIGVEDTHSYLIDGIVSHNTINVPENFEHEELMELILRYSDSLKGLTVYRAGSRENEPLQAIPTTKESVEMYAKIKELAGVVNEGCAGGSCEW